MRRRFYSTVSSFTGSPSRSCNVPEVMSVSPTLSPSMIWMLDTLPDLLAPAAIRDWFEHVYWKAGPERLGQPMIAGFEFGRNGTNFPFRSTAEAFRMIESTMVPVIIPGDKERTHEALHTDTLSVDRATYKELQSIAQRLGLRTPGRDPATDTSEDREAHMGQSEENPT